MCGMGRKSSAKGNNQTRPSEPGPAGRNRTSPYIIGGLAIAAIVVGFLVLGGGADQAAGPAAAAASQDASTPNAEQVARAAALAELGPREQPNLPPIPFQAFAPPRPMEVVTAAYHFAAEHPEILSYVPCFCGCERAGHQGNHDCFVRSRDANGYVTEWDEHGVECTICIDVANRSRQMYSAGASVTDIRAAIEKEFGPVYPGHTPTPAPPTPGASGN